MNPLFSALAETGKISDDLKADISGRLIDVNYKKKDIILRPGETCNHIYFVTKGLLRAYYIKDGADVSSVFMEEGDFVLSILSYFRRQPSHEFIEVLEDCQLCGFHYKDLAELYHKHVEFNIVGREFTESYLCLSEERMLGMRKCTAEEKFQFLLDKKTDLINRIPGKDLASYLGVSPETLSRMRSAIR